MLSCTDALDTLLGLPKRVADNAAEQHGLLELLVPARRSQPRGFLRGFRRIILGIVISQFVDQRGELFAPPHLMRYGRNELGDMHPALADDFHKLFTTDFPQQKFQHEIRLIAGEPFASDQG